MNFSSQTGTGTIGNCFTCKWNIFWNITSASADTTKERAVTRATHLDQAMAWRRWSKWCYEVGLGHALFLNLFNSDQIIKFLRAFSVSFHQGQFLPKTNETLTENTIWSAITHVPQTNQENNLPNPTKDKDGEFGRFLSRFFVTFKNEDEKDTIKALPAVILQELAKLRFFESQIALWELAIGAFFCLQVMWICQGPSYREKENWHSKIEVHQLFRYGIEINHSDPYLEHANRASLNFANQKNGIKDDVVTHQCTGDILFCPPQIFAKIVKQILNCKGSKDNTPISAVWKNKKINHITSKETKIALCNAVEAYGQMKLGIKNQNQNNLSDQSSHGNVFRWIPGLPNHDNGQWSSDAFLLFIRKQVEQFNHNVSSKMHHLYWIER